MKPLAILGINAAHDASACLLLDGLLEVAIAEERLTRRKHQRGYPSKSIDYCLQATGMRSLGSIDCVVLNQPPSLGLEHELVQRGFEGRLVVNPSHHLLHAYYAWRASGFEDAAIMVIDGSGYSYGEYVRRGSPLLGPPPAFSEMEEAESQYVARGDGIELVGKRWALWESSDRFYRFASLGHMYSMASQYIFGHWVHAGKTMGLAPYGDPSAIPQPFVELQGQDLVVRTDWPLTLPERSSLPAHLDPICRNLAAKVQLELERALLHLATILHQRTGQRRLCISGGVGLNSVANGRICRESPFSELFVTPAAGDSGTAIGAALYGHHLLAGTPAQWTRRRSDYLGRHYRAADIAEAIALHRQRLRVDDVADAAGCAARDLVDGLVIGWFEGGSEFGPRALGHRSILCDPRSAEARDRLNTAVKFREPFRPYAASVLAENVSEYFESEVDDPFMLIVASVRPSCRQAVQAICHVDGTCRIQTVAPSDVGRFRSLIERFRDFTGVPMVLNTSFNIRGEPIVETPTEAIECFLSTNIDVLYLEGRRATKTRIASAARPSELVPFLNEGLSLLRQSEAVAGTASEPQYFVQTRTGHRQPLSAFEHALLESIDGIRTIGQIKSGLPELQCPDICSAYASLQWRGFVSFSMESEALEMADWTEPRVGRTSASRSLSAGSTQ